MDAKEAKTLDYGIAMSVKSFIEAMSMHWENQQRIEKGESIAYNSDAFLAIIEENGIHHNAILERWFAAM